MQGLNREGNAFYDKAAGFRMPLQDLFRDVEPHLFFFHIKRAGRHGKGFIVGNVFRVEAFSCVKEGVN